jgi:hypothetical protein
MHERRWRDGILETDERHKLTETLYLPTELALMLELAGFEAIRTEDGYTGAEPKPESDVQVLIARKP